MRSPWWTFLALLILTSCSRGSSTVSPAPVPERQPTVPGEGPSIAGPSSWTFSASSAPRSYVTTESTTVTLDSQRDSSVTVTAYTIQQRQAGTTIGIKGSIDRIFPSGPTQSPPFPFSGSIRGGGLTIDSIQGHQVPVVMTCEEPALNRLGVVRRNVFMAPSTLSRNQSWTDSSTVPACSGSIPVQVTQIREYRVLGETGGAVLVDRRDRTVASGEGSQGQHRISLQARGTGSGQLRLDRMTGEVISATGM